MSFFNRSKTKILKQVELDIWDYCTLNPFKYNNFLRKSFDLKYNRISLSRKEFENASILVKADKRLKKLFLKKKSYFSKILLLKRKLRLFFEFFTYRSIEKFFVYLFRKKKNYIEKFTESLSIGLETFLFFFLIRIRCVFTFFEADFFIKQGLIKIDDHLVLDPFYYISIGSLITFNSNYIKSFFYKRQYIFWFNEFIRNGSFFIKIFSDYNLKNILLKSRLEELRRGFFKFRFPRFLIGNNKYSIHILVKNFLIRNQFFLNKNQYFLEGKFFRDSRIFLTTIYTNSNLFNYNNGYVYSNNINNSLLLYRPISFLLKNYSFLFFKFYYSFLLLRQLYFDLVNKLKNKLILNSILNLKKNLLQFYILNIFSFLYVFYIFILKKSIMYSIFFNEVKNYIIFNFRNSFDFCGGYDFEILFFDVMKYYYMSLKDLKFSGIKNMNENIKILFKGYRSYKRDFNVFKKMFFFRVLNKYFFLVKNLTNMPFYYLLEYSVMFVSNKVDVLVNIFIKRISKSFSLWNFDLIEKANNLNEFIIKELKKKKQMKFIKNRNYSIFLWKEDKDLKNFNKFIVGYRLKVSDIKKYKLKQLQSEKVKRTDDSVKMTNVSGNNFNNKEFIKKYSILKSIVKNLK